MSYLDVDLKSIKFEEKMNEAERRAAEELGLKVGWNYQPHNPPETRRQGLQERIDELRKEAARKKAAQEAFEAKRPAWQKVSGMKPEQTPVSRDELRVQERRLVKAAKILIRKHLRMYDSDPEKADRSPYWDPLDEVCEDLEMAKKALSKHCKHLTGLTAGQLCDAVRAEFVKGKIREGLRAKLQGFFESRERTAGQASSGTPVTAKRNGTKNVSSLHTVQNKPDRWEVWAYLKKQRRNPEWTINTWALELGFSCYIRMYRGCVAAFWKTPRQIELELIDEWLRAAKDHQSPRRRLPCS